MTKFIHIGLGKCGSKFLQEKIFPKISKKLNIQYIKLYDNKYIKINKYKIKFHAFEKFQKCEKLLPEKFIISHESLFSYRWEFSRVYKSFNILKKNFSKKTKILIVIRNPYQLLNSIYCQSIQDMKIVPPEKFFYYKVFDEKIRNGNKFNLYNFNYEKLISLYRSYFNDVIVVKYENLGNFNFLKKIFDLDNDYIKYLSLLKKKKINKSISKFGINFILFLNNYLNLSKYDQFIRNYLKTPDKLINKIRNKILAEFLIRNLFQSRIDKILPYKKYLINKKLIPIDIDKEVIKYKKLNY